MYVIMPQRCTCLMANQTEADHVYGVVGSTGAAPKMLSRKAAEQFFHYYQDKEKREEQRAGERQAQQALSDREGTQEAAALDRSRAKRASPPEGGEHHSGAAHIPSLRVAQAVSSSAEGTGKAQKQLSRALC